MIQPDTALPARPAAENQPAVRAYAPPTATRALAFGAVGGALGGAVVLLVLALLAGPSGHQPVAAPNAFGAWFVRWLQTAAPQALDGSYADATLGGIGVVLAAGALLGAVFAGGLDRLPDDHPLAWGLVWGLVIWATARWIVAPALDPVLLDAFDSRPLLPEVLPASVASALGPRVSAWLAIPHALLPACLAFGLWIGLWVNAGRRALAAAALAATAPAQGVRPGAAAPDPP